MTPLPLTARWRLAIVFAAFAVFFTYANSFHNGFHFDDFHTIVDNPAVRSLSNVPRFFTDATTFSVLPTNRTYRPVVSTSIAFDYALGHGYTPLWFHISTFFVFLALLALLLELYRRAFDTSETTPSNRWLALVCAAWFGLHPAIAETVNYIIQRGDIFCTVGCVGALVLWSAAPRLRRYGCYLLPLVFALLSKPPAAVFPALLLLWILFFEATGTTAQRWKRAAVSVIPSLAVVAALLVLQARMTPKTFQPSTLSAWDYRLIQPFVWLRYFGALFLPLHLNVDTDLGPATSFDGYVLAGMLFLVALLAAIAITACRRSTYPVAFGLLWFVFTELPTSAYALSEVENDHRMFFAFVGLVMATGWALHLLLARVPVSRRAIAAGVLLLLMAYAWGTHVRNRVWRSEESLWADDVKKSPHNGRGLMIYGLTLLSQGEPQLALDEFNHASQYTPNYPTLEINLGIAHDVLEHKEEAEHHFLRAISLAPGDDTTHAYYGRWLGQQGRNTEAIAQLREAVELNPARPLQQELLAEALQHRSDAPTADTWINRSLALSVAGRHEESITAAHEALKLDPNSAIAWNNIAAGESALHRWDPAIDAAKHAVALNPNFQLAHNNLAWAESQKALAK